MVKEFDREKYLKNVCKHVECLRLICDNEDCVNTGRKRYCPYRRDLEERSSCQYRAGNSKGSNPKVKNLDKVKMRGKLEFLHMIEFGDYTSVGEAEGLRHSTMKKYGMD